MWGYCYTIARNIFRLPEAIKTMKDMIELSKKRPDEYNEEIKYRYVQYIADIMQKTGHIKTEVYGEDNLPKEGGYMMYPNHQGKYDVYGIISTHKTPCTFVMDIKKSKVPIVPVALIDSYKPYNSWDVGEIKTQVHFLKLIHFDEYKDMNTHQIADLVKCRIADKIKEVKKEIK